MVLPPRTSVASSGASASADAAGDALRHALRLYALTPSCANLPAYLRAATCTLQAGATALQYRDKSGRTRGERLEIASALARICYKLGALFIVNDDLELALDSGADGVHLGPTDLPVAEARRSAGPHFIVGASAGTLEAAREAAAQGASYLGVGAIWDARASKADASDARGTDVLRTIRDGLPALPLVAIGGITTAERATACIDAGADGVAVLRGIFDAEDVRAATRAYVDALDALRDDPR